MQHLFEKTKSKAVIEEAANAVVWMHSSAGLTTPSPHPLVRATLEGMQCSLAKPVVKKELITVKC